MAPSVAEIQSNDSSRKVENVATKQGLPVNTVEDKVSEMRLLVDLITDPC